MRGFAFGVVIVDEEVTLENGTGRRRSVVVTLPRTSTSVDPGERTTPAVYNDMISEEEHCTKPSSTVVQNPSKHPPRNNAPQTYRTSHTSASKRNIHVPRAVSVMRGSGLGLPI